MSNHLARVNAIKQLEEQGVREELMKMESDPRLRKPATSSYSANTSLYPDNQIPFVDKHIAYLLNHPKLNPQQYLSNLRLMLKK